VEAHYILPTRYLLGDPVDELDWLHQLLPIDHLKFVGADLPTDTIESGGCDSSFSLVAPLRMRGKAYSFHADEPPQTQGSASSSASCAGTYGQSRSAPETACKSTQRTQGRYKSWSEDTEVRPLGSTIRYYNRLRSEGGRTGSGRTLPGRCADPLVRCLLSGYGEPRQS
jgi:hypothetical protein